jgi:cysteine desulfurase
MKFFDNASTTMVSDDIIEGIKLLNEKYFYNPGALYSEGRDVKFFIDDCRKNILENLHAEDGSNIIFTGSATEANNLALFGVVKKNTGKILVSMGEHPSVYNVALNLKERGFDVVFVNLNTIGSVDIDDFKNKMTKDVDVVSIMHVNNETGAINDIRRLVDIAREVNPNVVFHCDGVQAVGKLYVDLEDMDVDLYTMSAHKIHGLKGVGALVVKKGVVLKPILFGGGQENGIRSGTENVFGIYSLAKSIENSKQDLIMNFNSLTAMKNNFISYLKQCGLSLSVHSYDENSPYILSISFLGCRAETLLNLLNDKGFCVGNGSACSSKKSGNRVLENMGVPKDEIEGNLRISFSRMTKIEDVRSLMYVLVDVVKEYLNKVSK